MSSVFAKSRENDAAALIARVASSAASGVARRALVLRLSRLPPTLTRPHHLRLARAALDPLLDADRAEAFDLPNADTAVLWRGEGGPALQASLDAVAELFFGADAATADPAGLCVVLDLPEQAETLLCLARASHVPAGTAAPPDPRTPLDAAGLAALEAALAGADVSRFARRRLICAPGADGAFHVCWEKRLLSVAELEAALAPGRTTRTEPWLFRRLTATLERRMLASLSVRGELQGALPFALDLTVVSILGPEFLRFDAALPAALRGRVVLDLRAPDILSDLSAFRFARDFAHARGYRLLLHDPGPELLDVVPPNRLGVDLLRLRWSPALADSAGDAFGFEQSRLVLAGADTPEAIAWGQRHGVSLFQGRAVVPRPTRRTVRRR